MALLSIIRRWYFREKVSMREIARRTKLSRNTISKYLNSGEIEPRYPKRHRANQLDAYAEDLSAWLSRNQSTPRKQKQTIRQMHAALLSQGYTGSYNQVTVFARAWKQAEQERARTAGRHVFVPLSFVPGEAFQFDWSEDWAYIDGSRVKLQIAQFKLSHSRAFLLRAYWLQKHEMLFDAHNHAFAMFGGVPKRGIYDNMKTAVDKVCRGKIRNVNTRFTAMVSHYLFEAEFCNPASGWEKGQIEKNVQDARRRIWPEVPPLPSLNALNAWLEQRCRQLWETLPHPQWPDRTIASVWQDEQPLLLPVSMPFDGFVEHTKRVTPTCLVHVDRNRYSVPASFANRPVSVHLYAHRVVVTADGQVIAEHVRHIQRDDKYSRTFYDWRHYLSVVQRKPGALRNGAPFADMPKAFKALQSSLLDRPGGDREMVDILALVLTYDEQAVLTAVELAMEAGVPSKPHILNLLHRLLGADPPQPMETPPTLTLQVEPQADASRYDRLREGCYVA